ncbi:MAG: hypothetical protein J6Y10_05090 [Lachnospiraceae bacterium]|nr:hypothetical protein [Lachnospiraceae bacterium]
MKKKNGGARGRSTGRISRYVLLFLVFLGMMTVMTGCPNESPEEMEKDIRKEITEECSARVKTWLKADEPCAVWDEVLTVLTFDAGETQYSSTSGVRLVYAAEGSYLRENEKVDFLCVMNPSDKTCDLYVSSLPEARKDEVLSRICKDFPLSCQAKELHTDKTILVPMWYDRSSPGIRNWEKLSFRLDQKSFFERKMLPCHLDTKLNDTVQTVEFSDINSELSDNDAEVHRKEVQSYLDSTWKEQVAVEITLTDADFPSNEKLLFEWVRDAGIYRAVFRNADGTDVWSITKSYVLETKKSEYEQGIAWMPHWTICREDAAKSGKDAETRQYDEYYREVEARISDGGKFGVYLTETGKKLVDPTQNPDNAAVRATYLGVKDYGASETTKENVDHFQYRFLVDGEEKTFAIDNSAVDAAGKPLYPIQNKLKEGYDYLIRVVDDLVLEADEVTSESDNVFEPVVAGNPGEKTVLNFIKTALMPVGTTLYVYGGGWDWQDEGSAVQARTIGVSPDWIRFFEIQDVNYTFRDVDDNPDKRDPKTSYYPFGGYNEYYYAGLDCSGFVGWALYNTFETENGLDGYVCSSTKMAKMLADKGWGDCSQELKNTGEEWSHPLRPGDVVSIKGHVWISLGTCKDGSILIVHSTNGFVSRTGQPGGGVAIGAIGSSKDCEAYKLADEYMAKYYPKWYERYEIALSNPDKYLTFEGDTAGRFAWDVDTAGGLTDAEHVKEMTPAEVLKLCFGE